ncbi:MFS general substrate transporter [Aspergillus homomorphus CBS 101889]|uniref:MFS general substrate transporter n=1 Tax=Aspergillus homomorphus (strain CBS 101889) TaxID=1450537 RepID=A0A395I3C3_ASPHC|nr:MFS general substrate transporter [Aspergillus homomorphus CBS 101889]RAL14580.1 MFS general substrate transporter [Aspergillus homomorphus CBS 101889]
MAFHGNVSSTQGRRTWYHTTLFNAFVIGGVGFLAPGLWNAMSSLGAGGAESPFLINAANALVFGLMGFLCIFGAPIANRIGLNWTLLLGAVGYPIYSAALYTNNRYGNVWFVLVGSVACGLSAGLFWASEGAVALGYPEPGKRGKYMNIWLWFRTGGPLLGGAIVLGLNHTPGGKGKVQPEVYLIFVALQCLAVPVAYFLSPPAKVQRSDGSPVRIIAQGSWRAEMYELWKLCRQKQVLLLLPVFWAAYFNQYSGNFETYYFNVRARALMGFVSNFANLLSSGMISRFLDYKGLPVKSRIIYSFYYVIIVHIAAWTYGWVVQEQFTANPPVLDWTSKDFVKGFFVLILWQFAQQALQNFLYYLVSTMTDNISELSRYSGILRGQESFAQAVSFGLNTRDWYGGRVPLSVNTILLGLAVIPTWLVVKDHTPIEHNKDEITQSRVEDEERVSGLGSLGGEEQDGFVVRETAATKMA